MSSGIKKILKSLFITVVITILFSIFTNYINVPQYRVNELMKAIKAKDYSGFKILVNQEVLVNNIYKTNKAKYVPDDTDDWPSTIDKYLHLGIATLIEGPTKEDINVVIDTYFNAKLDDLTILSSDVIKFALDLDYDSLKVLDVKEQSKTLHLLTFSLHNKTYNHNFEFHSVWEKHGKNWQVINITNIAAIIETYKSLEKDRLNNSISKKTQEMLHRVEIQHYQGDVRDKTFLSFFKFYRSRHRFEIMNMTGQTVVSYGIKLTYKDNQGYSKMETRSSFSQPIAPHETVKVEFWSYNPFVSSEMEDGNNPEINFTFIKYESGEEELNEDNLKTRYFE
jgi:hypothetical protein